MQNGQNSMSGTVGRDLILGGIVVSAAMLLVVGAGPALAGLAAIDPTLAVSVILNVALLLFSWRRYAEFRVESGKRQVAEEKLAVIARQDALTGLLSRQSFLEDAATLMRRARKRGKAVAFVMIDLDHFRTINDMNGIAIGDAALKRAASIISAELPTGAVSARLGADEFAALLVGDREDIDACAARLVAELGERAEIGGVDVHSGASLGVALADEGCATLEKLMRRADIAMYASKNAGRNRYHWFDTSMERELSMRNAIEQGIRDGVPAGQFVPFYEQQIDLSTGKLLGFEMLARWEHPTRGIIPPDIFIPVAEEAGLISDLSTSVMRQAMEEAKNWDASLSLSVNIAPSQLRDPWFAHKILKLLVETGFPATRLEIEITEGALAENLGVAEQVVGSLKNQGIRIALDDFGTGSSSLSNLRALPFDRVKIDRSFVTSLMGSADSAAMVSAITNLSDSLGLPVTAEGVETPEIEAHLKTLGTYQAQGWRFGKPMDVGQVRKLLAERNLLPVARLVAPAGERVRELRRLA
jgi:diguanylate cyclase (GGDEF)-like protein